MDKLFQLKANNTKVGTEVLAGVTTFFTMAYIIFVNPSILSATGMPWNGVDPIPVAAQIVSERFRYH